MKNNLTLYFCITFFFVLVVTLTTQAQTSEPGKYILEHDAQVAKEQPGPHDGGGQSIGYSFFDGVKAYKTAFKKRTLKPGSSIGYHLQQEDEIYYILSGTGEMKMNGKTFPVKSGDAILTRPGSSHGLTPDKNTELTLIIVYPKN
ncbi:cupin domain-containing protein [Adhaeribacter radiodurans]|uniref:Cupin domain-containing protein n=1 Tax=Adhaeribacter radiodurans TaxID=2745197 RepID=A0A7L7LA82_9BACT|nr:cupin domain-containing protein [Adhaeribacter radiodurans]QMU29647.1 cupin domain-containing protein [Adhaeribacter radiodurans]